MSTLIDRSISLRCTTGVLIAFALAATIVLAVGPRDYPNLHTILDTSVALLSAVLVLLLWDMGSRSGHLFYKSLAIAFAVTSALEIVHVLVTVEWSGALAPIAASQSFLRPATWPPAAHLLPLAIGGALWRKRRGDTGVLGYAAAVTGLGIALFVAFQYLPIYTPAHLDVTRPALALVPLLWLAVGAAAWRLRASDRILRPLAWLSAAILLGSVAMLQSTAPADGPAMVAHLGKISGYLILLLSAMQMGSLDMAERIRAEAALARLNQDLDRRIGERTADLVAANDALTAEVEQRGAADEELRQSTALLRATFAAAPFPISVAAPDATVLMWNRAAERVFGYGADEIVGRRYTDVIGVEDEAGYSENFRRAAAGESLTGIRVKRTARNGKTLDIDFSCAPVRGADGTIRAIVYVLEDVTQRTATEGQLRQVQKMEAIGNLTGGMAHDFNNLLGVIIGNLELAPPALDERNVAALGEIVGEALDAALRGADLTRRLLAFARQQPLQPARVELGALVAGMVKLLRRTLGENIEISLDVAADLWPVLVDAAQLEAAIVNLATNARDAMPRGGRLMIVTANRHLDEDYAAQHSEVVAGDYVMVEVSDTGLGIAPDVLERVFEPFYTTKERGKGTGLGLSMVFGFIKQSGGHINVYSELGAGTTFRLYLPRAEIAAEQGETIVAPLPLGGGETILVVEDNAALRRIVVRQTQALGYRVLEADGAAAALACLESEKVDLLFTDVLMPGGVDGFVLAQQAIAQWPALKVVLTSGFPETRLDGDLGVSGARLLSKPYRRDELGRLLRDVLDE